MRELTRREESQPPVSTPHKRFLQTRNVYHTLKKSTPNGSKDKGEKKIVNPERRTKHREDPLQQRARNERMIECLGNAKESLAIHT